MKSLVSVMLFIAALSVPAQSAKVIPLDLADTAEIQSLYAQQAEINKKIEDFRSKVSKKYTQERFSEQPNCHLVFQGDIGYSTYWVSGAPVWSAYAEPKSGVGASAKTPSGNDTGIGWPSKAYCYKQGWENGFIYSDDFRFIVPAPEKSHSDTCTGLCRAFVGYQADYPIN